MVAASTSDIATEMAARAADLLAALDDDRRARATFAFDAPAREVWAYFPTDNPGALVGGFGGEARVRAMALVATALSVPGLAKVTAIMALDAVLDRLEASSRAPVRDLGRYAVAVFGEPGATGAWAWRFEGHHVSIHVTVLDGDVVATTPLFLGANPALVDDGAHVVTRPCGGEEDAARALLSSLDAEQHARAVVHASAPGDIVLGNLSEVPSVVEAEPAAVTFDATAPIGIAASDLDGRQQLVLRDLVDVYLGRLEPTLANDERARLGRRGGVGALSFAWAGSTRTGEPHYYRVTGPSFVVEYDNVQDGANHVHAVWRDPARDFGRDPLRAHHRAHHR